MPHLVYFNQQQLFQGTFWPLLPWIVMEFVRLFAKLIFFIMVIIVWAIYMGEGEDTSNIIATGVIGAAVMGTCQNAKATYCTIINFENTQQLFSFLLLPMALCCQLFSTFTGNTSNRKFAQGPRFPKS